MYIYIYLNNNKVINVLSVAISTYGFCKTDKLGMGSAV